MFKGCFQKKFFSLALDVYALDLDFCVFVKSTDFEICDVIMGIAK